MPELPEVETIARNLREGEQNGKFRRKPNSSELIPSLIGYCIREAQLFWIKSLAEPTPEEFHQRIIGQVIKQVSPRLIVIETDQFPVVLHQDRVRSGGMGVVREMEDERAIRQFAAGGQNR